MFFKFYGTRGSVPVCTRNTRKHGGNTTCLYVEARSGDMIIVDAGTGIRELGNELVSKRKQRLNLLFTHYHWDHIQGFPFFAPVFVAGNEIVIHGPADEVAAEKALNYQMTMPFFPANMAGLPANITFKTLKKTLAIGSIEIETIVTNHPNHTRGLKFTEGKSGFVFLTDNELHAQNGRTGYDDFVRFIRGADLFIHDAQYTDEIYEKRKGWGHSTYRQVAELARDAGVNRFMVTHHDHTSTDSFIEKNIRDIKKRYPKQKIEAAADGKTRRF